MDRASSSPPWSRRLVSAGLVVLLLLSALAPAAAAESSVVADAPAAANPSAPPDPTSDVIGWEDGYWHNESISVEQSDGLSDPELRRFVARSMARVEYLRRNEFQKRVQVEVISREAYRNRTQQGVGNRTTFDRWNDQVWEALFIIGEGTGSDEALSETQSAAVAGFYSPTDDEIKIITDTPESPTISNVTLIHELVHALQDQHYNLTNATYRAQTQDGSLAVDGIVEGEASYIESRYATRCGDEWRCVPRPQSGGGGGGGQINLGIFLTIYNPYSDGPVYVHQLVERGGWDAFEERFRNPPVASEQVIHVTDEKPVPIRFDSTARNGWRLFENQGVNGSDTVGEASIFSMFWYQAREYGANTIDTNSLFQTSSRYDAYNYDAAPSNGWANDRVFPYHQGNGSDARYGYVWVTRWDTRSDATEFREAYREILAAHDVRVTDEGYYVIPSGPYADAFLVNQTGTRVVIVNGPTVQAVKDIRPGLTPERAAESTPTATVSATPTNTPSRVDGTPTGTTTTTTAGFGFLVAVLAVALAGLLARRR